MSSEPHVSIYIITCLTSEERGQVLKRTCEWTLKQRYPNFEVVVSDNGGGYSAADALASIQDPRLKVCTNEKNAGFTGNINRCLQHCSYDIIKPLCDDDLIHLDFLSATVPLVDDDTLVAVDVQNFILDQEPEGIGDPLGLPLPTEIRKAGYGPDIWSLPYANSCIPSALIFTRKLFSDLGGLDDQTELSDWDFFAEACLRKRVVHVMKTLCHVGVWDEAETVMKLRDEPYYFAHEGLYTSFRALRCWGLPGKERRTILLRLWRQFLMDSLIPLKHPFSRPHREGYAGYARRFLQWMFSGTTRFGQARQPITRDKG